MAKKGFEAFFSVYASVYGERWPELLAALKSPAQKVARLNAFADGVAERAYESFGAVKCLADATEVKPQPSGNQLFDFYLMDAASIFPVLALGVQPGDEVLDLCAAPGGKSLILAEVLNGTGKLVSNELSPARRGRLRAVLEDYLPRTFFESCVKVAGHDGARWCLHETEAFDRILVDAPCSGERHLLDNREEMKVWSSARSKNLAVRQYALLTSALAVVRSGGRLVYSTCSISPLENDEVIARLLKKRAGEARVVPANAPFGEATEHGWSVLPDKTPYGPIYFSVLEKL